MRNQAEVTPFSIEPKIKQKRSKKRKSKEINSFKLEKLSASDIV